MSQAPASLELTHVLYDSTSHVSFALAMVTLSPILLMASYATLAIMTREMIVIEMWAGQLACEALNWVLKRLIKQERPLDTHGHGYGFPSSHSQYMTYFATFLILHLHFYHQFTASSIPILDTLWRLAVYMGLILWAGIVCYSRLHLTYHTPTQVIWGAIVGIAFACITYLSVEFIPRTYPNSSLGKLRSFLISNPISMWFRIRDGWAVWDDGGRETEWQLWKARWDQRVQRSKTE